MRTFADFGPRGLGGNGKGRWVRRGWRGFAWFAVRRLGAFARDVPILASVQPRAIPLLGPHAMLGAGLQRGGDLEEVAVADEVLHRVRWDEDFAFRHADVQLGAKMEALGN